MVGLMRHLSLTTPAGSTDHLAEYVSDSPGVLFDLVYDPWPTPLAAAWKARGAAP
jgi:shikimate dehydrogenase